MAYTTESYIEKVQKVHNNLYDYSKVVYKNIQTKIIIIDPEYGEFIQSAVGHLNGQGHPVRGRKKATESRRMPFDEFVSRAQELHGTLYDYSKVKYTQCDSPVCIIDPVYGEFWQSPYQHLRSHGCPSRTRAKEWYIHRDHIIPLSILCTKNRTHSWISKRPLYKFLNSEINLMNVPAKFNRDKSDTVIINGIKLHASAVRNNYDILLHLAETLLSVDITDLISEDRQYILDMLNLNNDK